MRDQTIVQYMEGAHARIQQLENRLSGIYKVLEEIIGKELLRGQALHKVLMDKALFTDAELKTALEKLVAEAKVDMEKMKAEAEAAKAKAVELLVPAGANLTPPVESPAETSAPPPSELQTPNSEQSTEK
jgi:ribosomal protein L15